MNKKSVDVRNGAFWLRQLLGETLLFLKKKELDTVRSEYVEIVNASEISIVIDEIYYVWNKSDIETVPKKNTVNISAVYLLTMI